MPESSRDEIAKLEALYAKNPEGRVFTHLAEAYRKAGELDRARAILEEGLLKHAGYASAHVVLGRVLMGLEQTDEAIETFGRVLRLDPHNLIALRSLGDISRAAGRNTESLHYFEELRQQDPNNDEIAEIIADLRAAPAETMTPEVHAHEPEPDAAYVEAQSHDPAPPTEPAPEPEPEPEPPIEEPTPQAEPVPDFVSQDIDLDWVPNLEDEGLPGDLGELAGFSSAPEGLSEPEIPTFALPDADDFGSLNSGSTEPEFEEGSIFDDVSLGGFDDTPEEPGIAAEIDLTGSLNASAEDAVWMPVDDVVTAAPDEIVFDEPLLEEPVFDEPVFEAPAAADAFDDPFAEVPEIPADELAEEEAGELVTETIAELYRSQGLHDRAADVYRTLLRERPGDVDLEAKLYEAESLARGEVPQHEATAKPAAEAPVQAFDPVAPEAIKPEPEPEPEPDLAEGWLAGAAGTAESAPTPYAWTEQPLETNADSEPPITDYLRSLLSWRPSAAVADERPAEPEALPPEPVFDTLPGYEPEDAFGASSDDIVFSDTPPAEEEDVLMLLEEQVTAEVPRTEIPPLTAATVPVPDALPWEEPAAPAIPAAPTTPSNATNSEEAFDEWFGTPEPAPPAAPPAAPEPASPETGDSEGEDDDDLEMFRSWLQSLKK